MIISSYINKQVVNKLSESIMEHHYFQFQIKIMSNLFFKFFCFIANVTIHSLILIYYIVFLCTYFVSTYIMKKNCYILNGHNLKVTENLINTHLTYTHVKYLRNIEIYRQNTLIMQYMHLLTFGRNFV